MFFQKEENSIIYRDNGETVKISPWGKNSLRLQAVFMGEIPAGEIALLPVNEQATQIIIEERSAKIINGEITAELRLQDWGNALQIIYYNRKGEVLLKEIPLGGALFHKPRYYQPLSGGSYKIKATFESNDNEKIYGMGQYQQEIFNLKGCNLELAHRNSQSSIPFYLSSYGYGFLWHNAAIGEVHFGTNTTEWTAECADKIDYWITAGDTPRDILQQYCAVVGTPPMMPDYGMGFWQCKLRYYNQEQVLNVAREYKKRGVTPDVLIIDYYHWPRCGDWRFDKEYFPDPKSMVETLRDMGIQTMVSVWPQVDWRSENFDEMKRAGLLVKINSGIDVQMIFHGNNVFMDATNPETRQYVWNKCKENYADIGIKSFWLDEAEPEFTGYAFENYRYFAGPVLKIGNVYPREYSRIFYEGLRADGQKEIVNLVRAAWIGSQRYGALVWSGDIFSTFEDMRKQIVAGIQMGISGISWWTTDIGGFHGGDSRSPAFHELLIRWFEYGTFCPVMRLHGLRLPGKDIVNKSGEVREWTGADNEIWSFGEENEKILTKYIRLREAMRPYTKRLMREAHETGAPVIRPLFYQFPEDTECWDIKDEYLYGDNLLIAPVCREHARERTVYLQRGETWTLCSNGRIYEGGQTVRIDTPLACIPVFMRKKDAELFAALNLATSIV